MASTSKTEWKRQLGQLSQQICDIWQQFSEGTTDEDSLIAKVTPLEVERDRLRYLLSDSEKSKPVADPASAVKTLEAAWGIEYKDPSSNTRRLHDHLKKCYDLWTDPKEQFYAPYFAVFQSSGHGKSRLLSQLCTSHKIPHLYICFRPAKSTGYPLRTSELADFLTISPSQKKWDAVLSVVLDLFCTSQKDDSSESTSPFEKWESFKRTVSNGLESTICSKARLLVLDPRDIDIVQVPADSTSLPFLFVIDEARELVTAADEFGRSSFRMLRRSLSSYKKGIFAILMDTLASIANFTPTLENDPSLRAVTCNKLFSPFHLVVTVDIFSQPPATLTADDIKEELKPPNLVTKGRILWASTILGKKRANLSAVEKLARVTDEQLLAGADAYDWQSIVGLAATKLVGGRSEWSVDTLSRVTCLSVLSARAQVSIAPTSDSSSVSVGSHLATCVSISNCRDAVFSMYPSEPAVAAGAFHVVWAGGATQRHEHAMANYAKLLSHLQSSFVQGVVDAGQCGELVARLLVNIAWDLSVGCAEMFYTMISLECFLHNLIGFERLEEAKLVIDDHTILDAQLCCTHFIPITYVPNEQDLAKLMSRGAAAICQRNQVGVDLMIPLLLADGVISVLLISVKNHKSQFDKNWPSSAGSRVSLRAVCPKLSNKRPYFTVLMQLGAPDSMVFAGRHGQHSALAVFALRTFCPSLGANHPVHRQLEAILKARQGIDGICFDEPSVEVVPNLVPLHWTAEVRPRTAPPVEEGVFVPALPDAISSASTTSTSDQSDAMPAAFCLVDAVSRTRWAVAGTSKTTTQEVTALFQQQSLAATILRRSGVENQLMKRVLKPVKLSECIYQNGADGQGVIFLTINADDIGLVCTYPPSTSSVGGVAPVLQYQPGEVPEKLPDVVENYLKKLFDIEEKRKAGKKRELDRQTDSSETNSKKSKTQEETEHCQALSERAKTPE